MDKTGPLFTVIEGCWFQYRRVHCLKRIVCSFFTGMDR